jgi:hypothetical protein
LDLIKRTSLCYLGIFTFLKKAVLFFLRNPVGLII